MRTRGWGSFRGHAVKLLWLDRVTGIKGEHQDGGLLVTSPEESFNRQCEQSGLVLKQGSRCRCISG